ncbi:hypothetical protein OC835_005167 [Tilletia horrida]|nr:hypothetical protein OC835_005167 [Tilletia horrida]
MDASAAAAAIEVTQPTGESRSGTTLSDLPVEVLTIIARGLLPSGPSTAFPPRGSKASLGRAPARMPSLAYLRHLLAFALVSRACAAAALPVLYSVLLLRRTRQVRILADLFRASRTETHDLLAMRVTDLYLTPYDGLREANDRREDAERWDDNVRTLFDAARQVDNLSLTTMSTGSALQNFLHPRTQARPREVTIHNYSASTPDLHTMDLRPLSEVTHLHLVQFRPTRAMLDFLHGVEGSGAKHEPGTHPLTHLRLSSMGCHTFHGLPEYIETRERAMGREQRAANHATGRVASLPEAKPRERARITDHIHPDPRLSLTGQRQMWAQECLYNLAADADLLPNLRLVQIEVNATSILPMPSQPMERESPTVTLDPPLPTGTASGTAVTNISTGGFGAPFDQYSASAAPGQLATIDFPADVPLNETEANEWAAREREFRAAEERQRTAHRDLFWLQVREGKEALLKLFREARASAGLDSASAPFELRVVLTRPGGWNNAEAQAEFAAAAFSPARRAARGSRVDEHGLLSAPSSDGQLPWAKQSPPPPSSSPPTCWDDEDVFELAATRPWLAVYDGSSDEERAPDRPGWWTGELPRLNASSSSSSSSSSSRSSIAGGGAVLDA